MKTFFLLLVFPIVLRPSVLAQSDTSKHKTVIPAKTVSQKTILTIDQEQWIRNNYQHITGMKKDSAKMEIRKNFSSVSNASVEYMISRAAKLMQDDRKKHQAMAQQMLRSLTAQKNELAKKITEKEKELKKAKEKDKTDSLTKEITEMKNKMKDLEKEIRYLHQSK